MKDLKSNTLPEHAFRLNGGKLINNIIELKEGLKTMDSKIFSFHVNKNKNDFYNWVKDIYQDKVLAESIKYSKSAYDMMRVIEKRLNDIDKEKQKEVKEIMNAIEKVKNEPAKKPQQFNEERMIETTRLRIIRRLKSKFDKKDKKAGLNLKNINTIPICKMNREDMINQIKKVYNNG